MERLSLSAVTMAILLHSVMGISYYFLLARCSPAPLLGSWLFVASIGAVLQVVHIFPRWGCNCSSLCRLTLEMGVCLLTLDLMLTKLWCRIESLCHCAIVGILQQLVTEECTFANCEYWLLGITTSIIGACLLWFTVWATALPSRLRLDFTNWQTSVSLSVKRNIYNMAFGTPNMQHNSALRCQGSMQSFAS
ncbi:uncharacterized protein LOC111601918 [Drosophila hydei]|uniref:Uncharacterized protein LOC111601918 n=1 Tax=Drosophila hydei TaxID=7224 RepID=A0A6J1M164_DROHY|nr:uncharacterized protein LOC111601918 [Drosophila hydei]